MDILAFVMMLIIVFCIGFLFAGIKMPKRRSHYAFVPGNTGFPLTSPGTGAPMVSSTPWKEGNGICVAFYADGFIFIRHETDTYRNFVFIHQDCLGPILRMQGHPGLNPSEGGSSPSQHLN